MAKAKLAEVEITGTGVIAPRVQDCLQTFNSLTSALSNEATNIEELHHQHQILLENVPDEFGRFRIWCGNIGAHKNGRSSLDYRLRNASHVKHRVLSLLDDLIDVLKDATAIVSGEKVPSENLSIEPDSESEGQADDTNSDLAQGANAEATENKTESTQLRCRISELVTLLLRFSMTIRNPAPHDHLINSANFDASVFEKYDIRHVREKFPQADEYLVIRLRKAISWRRLYLKYREAHHHRLTDRLNAVEESLEENPRSNTVPQSTIASSLPKVIQQSEHFHLSVDNGSESGFSGASEATSASDPTKLRPPPLPEEGKDNNLGDCFQTETNGLSTSSRCMGRSGAALINVAELFSAPSFEAHQRQHHHKAFTKKQWGAFSVAHERSIDLKTIVSCPLCRQELTFYPELRLHLAKHLEQLALFAIPFSVRGTEEQDDGRINMDDDNSPIQEDGNDLSEKSDEPAEHSDDLIPNSEDAGYGIKTSVSDHYHWSLTAGLEDYVDDQTPLDNNDSMQEDGGDHSKRIDDLAQNSDSSMPDSQAIRNLVEEKVSELHHQFLLANPILSKGPRESSEDGSDDLTQDAANSSAREAIVGEQPQPGDEQRESSMKNDPAMPVQRGLLAGNEEIAEFPILPMASSQPSEGSVGNSNIIFTHMNAAPRPAREDEQPIMQTFVKHARHCRNCADPEGGSLCDRGLAYAQDIREYLYLKAGQVFSQYDQTEDYFPMQVKLPDGFEMIRDLMRVVDARERKRRPAPAVNHDKTYYVPDRRSYPSDNLYDDEIVEVEPRNPDEVRKKKTVYVPGRGSLYREDEKNRRQRQEREGPVIVYAAPLRSQNKEIKRRKAIEEEEFRAQPLPQLNSPSIPGLRLYLRLRLTTLRLDVALMAPML
ncbi:MAG: hypothetical protein Q9160_006447 [Pyrenula sp. 1 TL-2023]